MMKEILALDDVFPSQEAFSADADSLVQALLCYKNGDVEMDLEYALRCFFDQWTTEDVDMDYMFSMGKWLVKYVDDVPALVNRYAKSFTFDKMDIIDQAIFLLGYVEWKVLGTPKEILLNELIELAKRYAEDGTSKLVNGIMHYILSEMKV